MSPLSTALLVVVVGGVKVGSYVRKPVLPLIMTEEAAESVKIKWAKTRTQKWILTLFFPFSLRTSEKQDHNPNTCLEKDLWKRCQNTTNQPMCSEITGEIKQHKISSKPKMHMHRDRHKHIHTERQMNTHTHTQICTLTLRCTLTLTCTLTYTFSRLFSSSQHSIFNFLFTNYQKQKQIYFHFT